MPLSPDVLLEMRVPPLNTILKVQAHQCHLQGDNHFPTPFGHASSDAGRDDTTTTVITKYIYTLLQLARRESWALLGQNILIPIVYYVDCCFQNHTNPDRR